MRFASVLRCIAPIGALTLAACTPVATGTRAEFYGTREPFASEAVYFVVTDRFVDGDPANNQVDQGSGDTATFDRPIQLDGQGPANIGYLGGDFKGIVDNADYIADMGFTALWITPIVDNPDEAFLGGAAPGEATFTDKGKTGYHGYWGVNFFVVDEHLESDGVSFADLTATLRDKHDIKVVLDIVANHGSPAYTGPVEQPKFGEIYAADGTLIADHQNLHPNDLEAGNPLHAFYSREPDLAQLADLDPENPDVLEYIVAAYRQWIEQGAAAFRVDTIRHMPHSFWKAFSDRIRADEPGFFMFGESFDYDAAAIAEHTYPENGGISVLDFPGQRAMNEVFAGSAPYSRLLDELHLESGVYQNPYELMTFYDNHDMARMDADATGFINAHNWLFTSRGIPVVYYGSEAGFQAGTREHGGNRNLFGQAGVDAAAGHPIRKALSDVAAVRKRLPALQKGLQLNLDFTSDTAAFYRVYQDADRSQTALVLLNKGDEPVGFPIEWLGDASWRAEIGDPPMPRHATIRVAPNGVTVLSTEDVPAVVDTETLRALHEAARRPTF